MLQNAADSVIRRQTESQRLIYREEDRKTLTRLGIWIGCLGILMLAILFAILALT
ncbi:hypothetical protein ACNKU7_13035 [Microbulbifer sp. SA54]|uniref:hypothetical protein n=1 Tax=Microbulbifer sp. SA54 TaxID=3401577 RepID=UPI003AAA9295